VGGTAGGDGGALEPDHPMWIEFAQGMAPLMYTPVQKVIGSGAPAGRVLDVAAGHGKFGIGLLEAGAAREVTALDWPNVLALARANAEAAGVADRWRALPGDALTCDLGGLRHRAAAQLPAPLRPRHLPRFLNRVREALAPDGRVVIVEYLPDGTACRLRPGVVRRADARDDARGRCLHAGRVHGDAHRERFHRAHGPPVPGAARHVLVAERRVR
jgi:SAM-dependent methyltransferase